MTIQSIVDPIIPPAELTAFVNRILEDLPINSHIGENFLPTQVTPNDRWTTGLQSTRDYTGEADYRAWNTEPTFAERPGLMRITGNIVPLGQQMMLQEDMIRELKFSRERGVPDQVRTQIFNDAATLLRRVQNRLERARWEALDLASFTIGTPGVAPYTENNLQMQVDFNRAAGNRYDVTTMWDVGGTPIADEMALLEAAEDDGIEITRAVMPREVIRTLLTHSDYRDLFQTVRVMDRLTFRDMNEIRRDFGLPTIIPMTASTKRRTAVGTETVVRLLEKRIIYLPDTPVGSTMWGLSSYVGEPEVGATVANRGGPVVFVMRTLNPVAYYTVIDAVAIPVLFNPDDTWSVGVLT